MAVSLTAMYESLRHFTLATDLDGTFLAQEPHLAEPLYGLLRRSSNSTLIFVSGRSLETIRPLVDDLLIPSPDYIIADVGATVVDGRNFNHIQPLQGDIMQHWPGPVSIITAVPELEEFERQPVPQDQRMSFYAHPDQITPELLAKIRGMGCNVLFSHDRYLDILPKNVDKGATLRKLLEHLRYDSSKVVVAGDTMNDYGMLSIGLNGIVVGNAEEPLRRRLGERDYIYYASAHGPEGIYEGLKHYNLFSSRKTERQEHKGGDADLVMVYHRLPYQEMEDEDGVIQRVPPKSPNGIIPTLLGVFKSGIKGTWVAWKMHNKENNNFDVRVAVDEENIPGLDARLVPLSPKDVNLFYETFSKEALWPILFNFIERTSFNHAHWAHFQHINRLFAEATAEEAAHGATVWIHDYNLWLVPAYLRSLRPDLTIAFFHHTSFPSFDALSVLPWWGQIISSLLQCDYVGFHIPRYVCNFVDAVNVHCETVVHETTPAAPRFISYGCAVAASQYPTLISAEHRTLRLGAHPVGIHVEHIRNVLARRHTQKQIIRLRAELGNCRFLLSVERIDYVKGQIEKLTAFERLLEKHPEYRGNVTLINICTPAAPGMKIYESIQQEIEQSVGRINGRFATIEWTPVRFFFRSLPFDELISYYAAADIAWISPLRDGLNLVAKEYVIAKSTHDGRGVLLLSEFAGAAAELHGALLVNPYDITAMTDRLHQALTMTASEKTERMRRMARIIEHHDISAWADEFLDAARPQQVKASNLRLS